MIHTATHGGVFDDKDAANKSMMHGNSQLHRPDTQVSHEIDTSKLVQEGRTELQGWLLPFTEVFSKRRQFACDSFGRIHLIVGETSLCTYRMSPRLALHCVASLAGN